MALARVIPVRSAVLDYTNLTPASHSSVPPSMSAGQNIRASIVV